MGFIVLHILFGIISLESEKSPTPAIICISNSYIKHQNCFYGLLFIVVSYSVYLVYKNVIHINIYTLMTVLYCRKLVYCYVCVR